MTTPRRNVVDYMQYWSNEAIIADLDTRRSNFSILLDNSLYDLNIGNAIRSCNAFNGQEVILYKSKRWDRRSAVGAHNYLKFRHYKEIEDVTAWFMSLPERPHIVGVDNIPGAQDITKFTWDRSRHTVLVFGQEARSISENLLALCDDVVYIRQRGSTRSLNLASAAAVAMHEFCRDLP